MASTKAARAGSKSKKTLDKAAEEKAAESTEARVFPESEANTAGDHSASASEIAAAVSPAGDKKSGAEINAASMDAASAKLDKQDEKNEAEADNSVLGRVNRSGLYWIENEVSGERYVGESPQVGNDSAAKLKTRVTPLAHKPPRTGDLVRLKDGTSFTVPDGFGMDTNPDDWGRVNRPDGKPLF